MLARCYQVAHNLEFRSSAGVCKVQQHLEIAVHDEWLSTKPPMVRERRKQPLLVRIVDGTKLLEPKRRVVDVSDEPGDHNSLDPLYRQQRVPKVVGDECRANDSP